MRTPLEYIERIDQYLIGDLNQNEKTAFEAELENSENLKNAYANHLLIQQAISRKAILQEVEKYAPKITASNVLWTKFKWPIILSSILLISLSSVVLYSQLKNEKTEKSERQNSNGTKVQQAKTQGYLTQNTGVANLISGNASSGNGSEENFVRSTNLNINNSAYRSLDGLQTWIKPEIQYFSIDPQKSNTIECKDGTLIIIPANSIVDKKGNQIIENIQLEIVEALTIDKMLAYNLTTTSSGNTLSSGGMVYIQPSSNGEKLTFSEEKPCHIEIPCEDYNSEMKAWQGKTDAQGNIDWQNPKELERFLVPVDFASLDFAPVNFRPQFQSQLPYQNYLQSSVALEDSFYYSLSCTNKSLNAPINSNPREFNDYIPTGKAVTKSKDNTIAFGETTTIVLKGFTFSDDGKDRLKILSDKNPESFAINPKGFVTIPLGENKSRNLDILLKTEICDSMVFENVTVSLHKVTEINYNPQNCRSTPVQKVATCYIDPSSIQALRQKKFAKTFIATKEFEERLQELHALKNGQELLELYVNNLTMDLHELDQKVADKLKENEKAIFEKFARQKLGNVDLEGLNLADLADYYNESRKKYQVEITERRNQLEAKTNNELSVLSGKLNELQQNYATELVKDSGINPTALVNFPKIKRSVANKESYKISWNQPGWVNIDQFLHELSKGEKLLSINTKDQKGNAKIYQCINSLKTVIGLNYVDDQFTAHYPSASNSISSSFQNTYCVGITRSGDGKLMYASSTFNPYSTNSVDLNWVAIPEEELIVRLQELSPSNKDLIKSLKDEQERVRKATEFKKKQDEILQERQRILEEQKIHDAFIQQLKDCIDPCSEKYVRPVLDEEAITDSEENSLQQSGMISSARVWSNTDLMKYINNNIKFPVDFKDIEKQVKIYATMQFNEDGTLNNVSIRNPNPKFAEYEKAVIRVISSAPKEAFVQYNQDELNRYFVIPVTFENE